MTGAPASSPTDLVFRALADADIRYCLWRGSPRLARACAGLSDFDILVDGRQAGALTEVLARQGLRRAHTHPSRTVSGLEDWFGLAGPHGPLLHFHIHYRLVAGPSATSHFRLPWEQQVLDSRVRAADTGIYVAHPVVESGLLLVRCALQLRLRDLVPGAPAGAALVAKGNADLTQLMREDRLPELDSLLRDWLGAVPVPGMQLDGGEPAVTLARLWRLRRLVVRSLGHLAAMHGAHAAVRCWWREARSLSRLVARRCRLPLLLNRAGPTGGLLVLLQDQTGMHSAALAESLQRLFGSKFDVFLASGGRGLRRAQLARDRGMLAIGTIRAPDLGAEYSPDLVLADLDPATSSATAIRAIWNRL